MNPLALFSASLCIFLSRNVYEMCQMTMISAASTAAMCCACVIAKR